MSDSGSSTTSGHWSAGSGVSTPSPPHPQASPKYLGDAFGSPQTDNGFETDPDAFLLDEPAPRKRKVRGEVRASAGWWAHVLMGPPSARCPQAPSYFTFPWLLLLPLTSPGALFMPVSFDPASVPAFFAAFPRPVCTRPSLGLPHRTALLPHQACLLGPGSAPACQFLWPQRGFCSKAAAAPMR